MSAILILSSLPWVERLGWALVHFLWQGILISALYAAARRWILRTSSPNARYILACVALATMMAAPLVTWGVLRPSDLVSVAAHLDRGIAPTASVVDIIVREPLSPAVSAYWPGRFLPWVVTVWIAGAIAFWIRLIGGWAVALHMRSVRVRPAPAEWQQVLGKLGARIGLTRPVRLLVSGLVQAPAVVGWLRPVVLVPIGALSGLPPEQVEALLIHELAHIRRHDYLVNILQGIVEALLFYHPAIWWVSRHIRTEREMCCDDIAVTVTGDVLAYARALAELESHRPTHLRAAVAANGAPLADRIGRLLGQSRPVSRTLSGPGVIASAILLVVGACALVGQPARQPPGPLLEMNQLPAPPPPPPLHPAPPPRFDVASIKPNATGGPGMGIRALPGRLAADKVPLRFLIQYAYRLKPFQISGGPGWIGSDLYDVEAKAEGDPGAAQIRLMLQTLLEDRFKLKFHGETKELPVYALTVAKGGLKLSQPLEGSCVVPDPNSPMPPLPGQTPCGRPVVMITPSGARMAGGKVTMAALADVLSNMLARPVIDKTAFTGAFDIRLEFTPDQALAGVPAAPGTGDGGGPAPSADTAGPSIFTAIQEQLGLKLESARAPVEVLVIDQVARPTGN